MPDKQLILTNIDLDLWTDQVAEKVVLKLSRATETEQSPQPQGDHLFTSLKQAADYYGVCYQTISKNLDKIPHITIGRSIKIYKHDLENAIGKHNILTHKKGRTK